MFYKYILHSPFQQVSFVLVSPERTLLSLNLKTKVSINIYDFFQF